MKFIIHYKKFILIFLLIFIFNFTFARIVECDNVTKKCNWQEFIKSLGNLISYIVVISYWIAFLLVTIGSFLVMFHGPKANLYQKGVNMIKIAIFGYVLVLVSGVVFDIILEFFELKFEKTYKNSFNIVFLSTFLPEVYADSDYKSSTYTSWYMEVKKNVVTSLKCGEGATTTLNRLFRCAFEAADALKNLALILLALAIVASAAYIISVPIFGLKNIPRAYQILIWSIIGLVIILLSDVIKSQIQRLTEVK